ncbi:peptidase M14 [Muricoccus radiodurans]|uniref:peptidase M14 n=1 Tax=Muricoccus radiodurans TaxID=2231721 RepID=UPI003CEC4CDF
MTVPQPSLAVRLPVPDLRPYAAGGEVPGVWSFAAAAPGPHAVIVSLIHGNEIAGALVLARWLERGLRPLRGRLTLVFANLAAFNRFDPADPTLSRYVDEDLNRLWSPERLAARHDSVELRRARELLPVVERADVLLDLHSMLWPSEPLILAGRPARARDLACAIGTPCTVVADDGHPEGPRLIDYVPFASQDGRATAALVEGGMHWEPETPAVLDSSAIRLLGRLGMWPGVSAPPVPPPTAWEVTRTVVAATRHFAFAAGLRGGDVVPRAGTLIAQDGEAEIRTPHDDCLLVMPSPRVMRGHTAVRLARRICAGDPG